jgi:hypothetical protein
VYIPSRAAIVLCPYEHAVEKADPMMPEVTDRQREQLKALPK